MGRECRGLRRDDCSRLGHEEVIKILLNREDVDHDRAITKYCQAPLSWVATNGVLVSGLRSRWKGWPLQSTLLELTLSISRRILTTPWRPLARANDSAVSFLLSGVAERTSSCCKSVWATPAYPLSAAHMSGAHS